MAQTLKRHWRRTWRITVGSIVMIIGIILIPLPGPGLLVVIGGLAIMADEVAFARKIMDKLKLRLKQVEDRVRHTNRTNSE